jgi:septum formation protein
MTVPSLILASGSPRRAEILGRLGLPFRVSVPHTDESPRPGESPGATAERLARGKARAVAAALHEGLVLAADTVVTLEGRFLGKPGGEAEAREMLELLSGRTHEVITGVALRDAARGRGASGRESSSVRFAPLSPSDVAWYLGTGEWSDKAGGYGLQGAGGWLVEGVEGCPANVIGLPPQLVRRLFAELGRPLEDLLEGSP